MSIFLKEDGKARPGRVVIGVIALVLLLIIGVGDFFALRKTPRDKIALHYGGGIFEGAVFKGIIQPGRGMTFIGWGDHLILYPVTQRNYIISQNENEGDRHIKDAIVAPLQDHVAVTFEVATYFKLNVDKIRKFHEQIGLKYNASTDDGWNQMLNDSFRQQIENAVQEEARRYTVSQLYADQQTLVKIQNNIGTVLKERVSSVLGDEYFCGPTYVPGQSVCPDFTFIIKHVSVPDDIAKSYEAIKTAQNGVLEAQQKVLQSQAEAAAIRVTNEAFSRFGNAYFYTLLQAIKSGKIDFWVLPSGGNFTFQTPTVQHS